MVEANTGIRIQRVGLILSPESQVEMFSENDKLSNSKTVENPRGIHSLQSGMHLLYVHGRRLETEISVRKTPFKKGGSNNSQFIINPKSVKQKGLTNDQSNDVVQRVLSTK